MAEKLTSSPRSLGNVTQYGANIDRNTSSAFKDCGSVCSSTLVKTKACVRLALVRALLRVNNRPWQETKRRKVTILCTTGHNLNHSPVAPVSRWKTGFGTGLICIHGEQEIKAIQKQTTPGRSQQRKNTLYRPARQRWKAVHFVHLAVAHRGCEYSADTVKKDAHFRGKQ
jgi:hypothetical protein